ncbi:cell division protein ZapA [Anaerosolibacter carboniphilus]|uniref:Cell division protein ZapA n=1 Tax=Anaerosolibacter carboniphilus TaxID=1417629 RepID=A0A841L0X7_9FIRM|nr:cell division protein ZapA [Anaerosolibacter carboniphilus]MBB6218248.1 cell division protein ZapA [Anaerosolibacter carboniphilus]
MSNKSKVVVRINGQEYTLVGTEPREYMQKVANYVDDKMVVIAKQSKKLSTAMAAVLTSVNIADEYFKTKSQLEALEKEALQPLYELDQVRNQLAVATAEAEGQNQEYIEIIQRLEEDLRNATCMEQESQELLFENRELKEALSEKEQEIETIRKMNEDLQNKLFEMQIKYVQSRKELEAYIEGFDGEGKK